MPVSESQRRANNKWDKEHTTILACKVRKDYAERVKLKAAEKGTNVNAILLKALREFMGEKDGSEP